MGRPVMFFEITTQNLQKEQEFYAQLFEWTITPTPTPTPPHDFAEVTTGPGGINGGISQPGDNIASSLTVYVEVDDIPLYLERAGSLGGSTIFPAMRLPDGNLIAMLADPEGVMIGLYQKA